jgi:hypothetical protein
MEKEGAGYWKKDLKPHNLERGDSKRVVTVHHKKIEIFNQSIYWMGNREMHTQ